MDNDSQVKEKRRARGVYYSPSYLVDFIVEKAVAPLLVGKTPRQVAKLRIVDPACGAGVFLVGAYAYLLRWHRDQYLADLQAYSALLRPGRSGDWQLVPAERARILQSCIYGVDIDAQAVDTTRRALAIAASEDQLEIGKPALDLQPNIKCGNALIGFDFHQPATQKKESAAELARINAFDWRVAFPEVFAGRRGGFDAVIGNPPWVSLSGKFGARGYCKDEIQYMMQRYSGNTYMPNMYEYFIALGLMLIKPQGYLSYIVPDRLAYNDQFIALRRKILSKMTLLSLSFKVPFPNVVADALIFVLRNELAGQGSLVGFSQYGKFVIERNQQSLLSHPKCSFGHFADLKVMNLLNKIESHNKVKRIKELFDSTSGFGGRAELLQAGRSQANQIQALKGDSVGRYEIRKKYWFVFKKENLTGRTSDPKKLGAVPKILLRKTGDRIIATYDESGCYPEQSLYFLFNKKHDTSYKYILGVLNSKILNVYYGAKSVTNKDSIAQLKKIDLDELPIAVPDLDVLNDKYIHDKIDKLVNELLGLYDRRSSEKADLICDDITQKISIAESEIDNLVYQMYALSPEEIAAVTV